MPHLGSLQLHQEEETHSSTEKYCIIHFIQ